MKLALIGGGGLAKEVAEVATLCGFEVVGYFADKKNTDRWNYLGGLDCVVDHINDFKFFPAIGAINSSGMTRRRQIIEKFQDDKIEFVSIISPYAVVSEGVRLGVGVFLAHGVILSVDSHIDDHCIVNTNAVIGHDAYVGKYSIIAPLSFLAGNVKVESSVLVGPNSSILEGRTIGSGSVIGMGGCVYRDLKANSIVMPTKSKTLQF